MKKLNNTSILPFLRIVELYPDEYILVKIIESNDKTGYHTGIAIYTSANSDELYLISKEEHLVGETTVLTGENLLPVIGGFL